MNLNLHITGLCACVPDGKSVVIFLPNAYDFDYNGKPIGVGSPDRHTALLCLPQGMTIATPRRNWFPISKKQGLAWTDVIAFPLDGEDIWVSPVTPASASLPPPVKGPCPSNGEPNTHFGWTCNMADVNPTPLKPEVTAASFPTNLATARMRVTNGTWATKQLAVSLQAIIYWYYADMQGNRSAVPARAIADVVTVSIPITTGVQVIFSSNKGDITLTTMGADVDAYLANIPLSTLGNTLGGARTPEMHFLHFHRLSQQPIELYPYPDQASICTPLVTELIPHCPPARF
ncbi:MAG TPA: hypothetical protein VHG32_24010 [Thermoanaerobaculia bacterium]|jgi:hypothetical protein|nr:hypothetical protein [Thermoanaerobaculia bacterium]